METINVQLTPRELEVIKKALRCYHYEIFNRIRITAALPDKFPHPIDKYYHGEAEAAENILINLKK